MKEQWLEKYRKPIRVLHWVHTTAFLILLITGAIIFIPGVASALTYDSWTRIIHRFAAIVFVAGPVIFAVMNPRGTLAGVKEAFTWGASDIEWLKAAPRYYFLAEEESMPPQGHMNTGQKMWWFMVIVFGVVFVITGILMWVFKESLPYGVLRWAVLAHDIAFIATGCMFLVHVYLGVIHPLMRPMRTGAWNSMFRGTVSAEYAKAHHRKWYDEVTKN